MGLGRVLRKQRQERRLSRNCQGGKRRTIPRKLREIKGFCRIGGQISHTSKKRTQLINIGNTKGQQMHEQVFYLTINLSKYIMRYHFHLL